jgi:Flp pilus assembly protein TadD
MKSAEKHLLEAYQQQPTFPRYQMGLATYYLDVEQDAEAAMKYIKSLVELDPAHPGYQALMDKANGMLNQ